ncbi:CDP-glucose 4,6-dehydratase [Paenibacillus harenae]|uniref:CDP-glucose 4,6-dehydratase n=1 Tax=Paenibacillus harenae TaxID=306543 RepID=A0ABT9U423_PAEHA|nr:CDP-glucose 4,6-dehydratase [Paenibacillus harenae]MDQ0114390.1 CDP-glucose 4,6-dehydratase [Paenibacillus harenae]
MQIEKSAMEKMVITMDGANFWNGKKVFITGHTGFKGSWLGIWLSSLGAKVTGYALDAPTTPSLYRLSRLDSLIHSVIGDMRDMAKLQETLFAAEPDIVFHMAAQPLVRESYNRPVETYEVNVLGTVYLLDAIKQLGEAGKPVKAVVNITTDKCYENKEWVWGYRETDALGGYDPYSNSKACSELVTNSYWNSFFKNNGSGTSLATARAGNVIGGGDWANDRLIPDCLRAIHAREAITLRNRHAIRPWQHVLEPLSGYMLLAEKLVTEGSRYSGAWNFGPEDDSVQTVEWVVRQLSGKWGEGVDVRFEQQAQPHEATLLKLDCSKAKTILGWKPKWGLEEAIGKIADWHRRYERAEDVTDVCLEQINEYSLRHESGRLP